MRKSKPPVWYVLIVVIVFIAFDFAFVIIPSMEFAIGKLDEPSFHPSMLDEVYVQRLADSVELGFVGTAVILICLLLGVVCLLLGIARNYNKLDAKQNYLLAAFLLLFAVNKQPLPLVTILFVYHCNTFTYFAYPIMLFLFFHYSLRPAFRKWTWALIYIPIAYVITVYTAHFITWKGIYMPFTSFDGEFFGAYDLLCAVGFILFLCFGSFAAEENGSRWFMRAVSIFWVGWSAYVLLRIGAGHRLNVDNEFQVGITISAVIIVCYVIFANTRELFTANSELKIQQMHLERFQSLEAHVTEIAEINHMNKNQWMTANFYLENQQYEQLKTHISNSLGNFSKPFQFVVCGHDMIQAVLNDAAQRAKSLGFEINFKVPKSMPPLSITDNDTMILFGCLLDNALESCEGIEQEKRWIEVEVSFREPLMYITVTNARQGEIRPRKDGYASTKNAARLRHGHGLNIVRKTAKKYKGFPEYEHTENLFSAVVQIQVLTK